MEATDKQRLDQALVSRRLVSTRSQAEHYVRLGKVTVDGQVALKPGQMVRGVHELTVTASERYVSRAALKLASVTEALDIRFTGRTVLDVGSSTGGFTDYALQHGAVKVIAVDVGTDQLHPSLRGNPQIELHEQTDIRHVGLRPAPGVTVLTTAPDMVVADVSFISLRDILPHVAALCRPDTELVIMVKPQFEAINGAYKHKGVIKNDRMRRDILRDFESWLRGRFVIRDKADSAVAGATGNRERFYSLQLVRK